MTQQEYIVLYEKVRAGNCTREEMDLLQRYSKTFLKHEPWQPVMGNEAEVEASIINRINYSINKLKTRRLFIRLTAAAVIVLSFGTTVWLSLKQDLIHAKREETVAVKNKPVPRKIVPGSTKAMLTLANGQSIVLDGASNGVISTQGGSRIVKLANGKLAYRADKTDGAAVIYNTMTTPRGGRYDLTLADGTKVFLNAASSITYPTRFNGPNRKVSITGEAYFEVAKNANMPFIVAANGTETHVLGTHFNIMAYKDEPYVKTTLVEGAVKFKTGKAEVLLKPGQQGVLAENTDHISVHNANMEETLAWTKGYFIFQDEEIRSIMRKVARWYDVDVVYDAGLNYLSYGGSVSQYKNISDLLKVLQSTGTIHFKIEERRVIVMK